MNLAFLPLFLIAKRPKHKSVTLTIVQYNFEENFMRDKTAAELEATRPTDADVISFEFINNHFKYQGVYHPAIAFGKDMRKREPYEFFINLKPQTISSKNGMIFAENDKLYFQDTSTYGSMVDGKDLKNNALPLRNNSIINMGIIPAKKSGFYCVKVHVSF